MIGRLSYHLQVRFRHGVRVAYYRDVVRPRILKTAPVENTDDQTCEIHVLTSKNDYLNLIWALKSFYKASNRNYALCIHDDGTLDFQAHSTLLSHFPYARLQDRARSDEEMSQVLNNFQNCLEFRRTNQLAAKVFDFAHYLQTERMLLLDSDVLFFTSPNELLRRIEDASYRCNSVNRDVESAYTIEPNDVQRACGFDIVSRFNSGLGVIHKASLRLDWVEEFLGLPGILGHFWRIEQTLYALCSSRWGVELLPSEYDVRLQGDSVGLPCRHYVGAIRHRMYSEGIQRLQREGFLARGSS